MSTLVKRKKYVNRIRPFIGKDVIKVIVGQRRVGKSYFLDQIRKEILDQNPQINTIFINKELYEFDEIRECKVVSDDFSEFNK